LQYFNSPDRAGNYNVKIFSSLQNDKELNELNAASFSYLAMIDAGSSGCRAHVYRYGKLDSISGPLYILPQHESYKVKPGLSSFASNPTNAGESLQGLVEFLKKEVRYSK
jgi:Golgi nucleoside diphosphatase